MINLKQNKGHSLMEMMVVIGIVGILAFLGVPMFQGYQAKARQKEGFALMTGYYAAAQQTFANFDRYPGNFVSTAFNPHGQLMYRLVAANGNPIGVQDEDPDCVSTEDACTCGGGGCIEYIRAWEEIDPATNGGIGPETVADFCGALGPFAVTETTFSIRIAARINNRSANVDRYGINENKLIEACSDGLK